MILLDTHVWIWWSMDSERLSRRHREMIEDAEADGLAVSVYSFWEVAMLAQRRRIALTDSVENWIARMEAIPTLSILPLTPKLLLQSTTLPGDFHSDPADQIIVATARAYSMPILTQDRKILDYPHVRSFGPS